MLIISGSWGALQRGHFKNAISNFCYFLTWQFISEPEDLSLVDNLSLFFPVNILKNECESGTGTNTYCIERSGNN